VLAYADERGRDAFTFEPITSPYLEVGDDFVIRTPYSRTVITELREVPWAALGSSSQSLARAVPVVRGATPRLACHRERRSSG
jgi:hypothetical protein